MEEASNCSTGRGGNQKAALVRDSDVRIPGVSAITAEVKGPCAGPENWQA